MALIRVDIAKEKIQWVVNDYFLDNSSCEKKL